MLAVSILPPYSVPEASVILCYGPMKIYMYTLRGSILMKYYGFCVWRRLGFFQDCNIS